MTVRTPQISTVRTNTRSSQRFSAGWQKTGVVVAFAGWKNLLQYRTDCDTIQEGRCATRSIPESSDASDINPRWLLHSPPSSINIDDFKEPPVVLRHRTSQHHNNNNNNNIIPKSGNNDAFLFACASGGLCGSLPGFPSRFCDSQGTYNCYEIQSFLLFGSRRCRRRRPFSHTNPLSKLLLFLLLLPRPPSLTAHRLPHPCRRLSDMSL